MTFAKAAQGRLVVEKGVVRVYAIVRGLRLKAPIKNTPKDRVRTSVSYVKILIRFVEIVSEYTQPAAFF